jgi:hypothetical protein
MAFISCISAHEKNCSDYFSKILEINKNFNLSIAEAGHPLWGPVFQSVKLNTENVSTDKVIKVIKE